jgi:hypothetical protein
MVLSPGLPVDFKFKRVSFDGLFEALPGFIGTIELLIGVEMAGEEMFSGPAPEIII